MTHARLILLTALVALWPAQAHAAKGWWGWLEELSGPGPFEGYVFSFTLACDEPRGWEPCALETTETKRTIELRVGWFESDADERRFRDLPADDADNRGRVSVLPVSGLYLVRLHRSLQAGPGVGFMRLSGAGFSSFYRLTLTPLSASFKPFALRRGWEHSPWSSVLRLELDTSFVPQGFTGADFNNTRTSFDSGPEFLTRAGAVLDLGAAAGATWSSLRR